MAKSKFFCIAVEGATTDGRNIEGDWIDQMASSYNPATYTARINCEHLRGFSPDAPFNAYGSVTALESRTIDLEVGGKSEKRKALFAQLDANDQLVTINKAGQKLFTSCEVQPNFAGTKGAYLVGLAVTDSPASLGTEALSFAALKPMFAARKLHADNLFTAASEAKLELEADDGAGLLAGIKSAIEAGFAKFTGTTTPPAPPAPPAPLAPPAPPAAPAPPPANDNFSDFAKAVGEQLAAAVEKVAEASRTEAAAIRTELSALKTKVETTEQPGFSRKPAAGGSVAVVADF